MIRKWRALTVALAMASVATAAQYYVSPQGSDKADGAEAVRPFRTIQRGVNALKPGDTLTILPGVYAESVMVTVSGEKGKPTVIRAQRPGTVVLQGDRPLEGFRKVAGTRCTYAAPCEAPVPAVTECDTLSLYARAPSAVEVEDIRGSFYFDAKARRIYVRTTDSRGPEVHRVSVSAGVLCG